MKIGTFVFRRGYGTDYFTFRSFGKTRTIGLLDVDGAEHMLYLPKSCKMRVGQQYRLYFSQRHSPCSGNRRLDAAQTESFLGYEAIADETPSSTS